VLQQIFLKIIIKAVPEGSAFVIYWADYPISFYVHMKELTWINYFRKDFLGHFQG